MADTPEAIEVSRIAANVSSTLEAIAEKGVEIPASANSDSMASLVASIPSVRLLAFTAVLSSSAWADSLQSISASGVSSDETACHVIVTPSPDSHDSYIECGVRCVSQGENELIFLAVDEPGEDLIVNITILK